LDILQGANVDLGDTLTTMLGAPLWLKDVQIPVWWEPLVQGSQEVRWSERAQYASASNSYGRHS